MSREDADASDAATRWPRAYVVVPVVTGGLSVVLAAADPTTVGPAPVRLLGVAPAVAGVGLVAWTTLTFARAGETLSPVTTPDRLVVAGPLARTRNPMYLGVVSVAAGVALLAGSPAVAAYAAVLLVVYHAVVVLWEEPKLQAAFGDDYDDYRTRVPRWVPRLRR